MLLTAEDIAPFLKLHPNTVYRLASQKVIPSFKVGRSVRFDLPSVLSALRANGTQHAQAARSR